MPDHRIPKVFISYSWSSPEYGERVIDFVNDLRAAGVEVVFDRLDLTEGQDKYAYMERAVTDESVDRVLVLCDPLYADKADGRRGGVGTETQIMSPQVYGSADQKKFIPVIMERDGDQIRVPTYLNASVYFDLTGPDRIVHFERLVRRLHGKPDLERSPLGPPPSYVNERRPELRTGRALDIFKDTVERERGHQTVRLNDYLVRLTAILDEETELPADAPDMADEWAVEVIERLRPYRDEFADGVNFIGRYDEQGKFTASLHGFFERLLATRYARWARHFGEEAESTPLAFIAWELFLCTVAVLLRESRFEQVRMLFEPYRAPSRGQGETGALRAFDALDPGFPLLDDTRKYRLRLNRISVSADMIRERATSAELPFSLLVQADVVCWLRSVLTPEPSGWRWYPRLLSRAGNTDTLPLFVRAARTSVFEQVARMLGVADRETLLKKWADLRDGMFEGPDGFWGSRSRYETLIQLANLGTR